MMTTLTTHTPGPWTVDGNEIFGPPDEGNIDSGVVVARRVNPADARLIAAAPDMLDALLRIANFDPTQWDAATLGNIARAALVKATGEQA